MSNREIKFRTWHHGISQMYKVYGFNKRQIQWENENGELGGSFSWGKRNKNTFTLEQYTGLKDRNGVEIYEGDITDKGLVVFHQDYLGFFVKLPNLSYNPLYDSGSLKVIGNIHQNPELL